MLWLRLGDSDLPSSTVGTIVEEAGQPVAQYASHVENVVANGFGDARLSRGDQAFELARTAKAFYRYFAGTYHSLAMVLWRSPTFTHGA